MFSSNLLENGLGIVSASHFMHDFSAKNSLPDWLCLYFMCLKIVCFPVCDVIKFGILIKHEQKVKTKS